MKKQSKFKSHLSSIIFTFAFYLLSAAAVSAQTIVVPKPSQGKTRPASNAPNPRAGSTVQPTTAETRLKAAKALLPATGSSNGSVQIGESVILDTKNLKTAKGYLILQNLSSIYPNFATLNSSSRIIVNLENLPKGKYLLIFDVQLTSGAGKFFLVKKGDAYDEVNYPSGKQKLFFVVDVEGGFNIFRLEADVDFTFYAVEAVQLKQ